VQDANRVRRADTIGDLGADQQRVLDQQPTLLADQLVQRLAGDVLERHPERAVVGLPGVEQADHVRVLHPAHRVDLVIEVRHGFARHRARERDLDGGFAARDGPMSREEDLAHATFADRLDDLVVSYDIGRLQQRARHGRRPLHAVAMVTQRGSTRVA
jgi:hypothetical protein